MCPSSDPLLGAAFQVMVQIGGLLPAATVKLGCLPHVVSDQSSKALLPQVHRNKLPKRAAV